MGVNCLYGKTVHFDDTLLLKNVHLIASSQSALPQKLLLFSFVRNISVKEV
jgi:hypothetical protein